MYNEKNTGTNLPAQIDIFATKGNEYKFLFMAKGGGSANKTFLFQQTKALLNPTSLLKVRAVSLETRAFVSVCFSLCLSLCVAVSLLILHILHLSKFLFLSKGGGSANKTLIPPRNSVPGWNLL